MMKVLCLKLFRFSHDGFTVEVAAPGDIAVVPDSSVQGLCDKGLATTDLRYVSDDYDDHDVRLKPLDADDVAADADVDNDPGSEEEVTIPLDWETLSAKEAKGLATKLGYAVSNKSDAVAAIQDYLAENGYDSE